jgi:hypothetical protein
MAVSIIVEFICNILIASLIMILFSELDAYLRALPQYIFITGLQIIVRAFLGNYILSIKLINYMLTKNLSVLLISLFNLVCVYSVFMLLIIIFNFFEDLAEIFFHYKFLVPMVISIFITPYFIVLYANKRK